MDEWIRLERGWQHVRYPTLSNAHIPTPLRFTSSCSYLEDQGRRGSSRCQYQPSRCCHQEQ